MGKRLLVNLLHLGALIVLKWGQVIILILVLGCVVLVNAQAKLDHAVDAASKGGGLIEVEARGEQGGVEQEPDEILYGLVVLVLVGTSTQSIDDGVSGVHFHRLLG